MEVAPYGVEKKPRACIFAKICVMIKEEISVAIIGCGNLGMAIATGLLDAGIDPGQIATTRRNTSTLNHLKERGVAVISDNRMAIEGKKIVLLAVKPYNVDPILNELAAGINPKDHIVVSLATGITMAHLAALLPEGTPVFRAMPNTAADVKQSLTCISYMHAGPAEVDAVNSVFASLGRVIFIEEGLMEGATVLGACGIAYVMRFIRAMVQGGIEIGFDAQTASAIVQQTVLGAAVLLTERGSHPESEIDKVTTPKGCTIAGLNEMEHHGFSSALIKGIITSFEKIEPA